ncbi:MAG TPA: 2-oxoacid:acceptor oxidoreductase family protein [Polyangiaceae bacterium]|nr:2-oxoacid:acceptor oxidoreductase family protein [Polyangiaceae bacterium]
MAGNRIAELIDAADGHRAVLQGNIAFAVGCARGGIHAADGYPGTPSTEVIDKGLRYLQDRMNVGWSVNEANAVAVGLGETMRGADAVVTMKIPGLFQAADVVATAAGYTARRGGLVLYVASDFVPSSTQYVFDPRYFLKSCFLPVIEPRNHQEMLEAGPFAARIARDHGTIVVVLANGLICHSEGLIELGPRIPQPPLGPVPDFSAFMNLPEIARSNYVSIVTKRMAAMARIAEEPRLARIEWNDRGLGLIVHGVTELYLREIWDRLPVKPSVLSLGMTFPVPLEKAREFAAELSSPPIVLGDGYRFVQEELLGRGIEVGGKHASDTVTEWTPDSLGQRLGAQVRLSLTAREKVAPVRRPPGICAGCPYRAFGLVVEKLRKKKKIVAAFGDIGCNTLLYFLKAIDTCTCMGAADSKRQGVVLADKSLASRTISVIGDATECHSGMDSTRNAVYRNIPGVKVILDNSITAMTGGQPAPSSAHNLAGETMRFDLVAALQGEGACVQVADAFDMAAIESALRAALEAAEEGKYRVLVIRGECMQQVPSDKKMPRWEIDHDKCKKCDLCLVCPGVEKDDEGFPVFTHLCTGCGGNKPVCRQGCHLNAIVARKEAKRGAPPPALPELAAWDGSPPADLPSRVRVVTRGVGGQGSLFLGKVLAEVAAMAGFRNVVKGETHGMAQLGGSVLSTFACGDVHSPVVAPGSVDVLVALEESEVLRPGFLELLAPGGTVLLNQVRILPVGSKEKDYPTRESILASLEGLRVVQFDALAETRAIGDDQGRTANVVALGLLSTIEPLCRIPEGAWQRALLAVTPTELARRANVAAFSRGRAVR